MEQRRAVIGKLASKYRATRSRKERSRMLDEIQELTNYDRHYAAVLLRNYGKRRVLTDSKGRTVELVVGHKNKRRPVTRPRVYDESVRQQIVFLWEYFDQMCGKRLVAMIPDILPTLVRRTHLQHSAQLHQKLLSISAATVERMLKDERVKHRLKGNCHTKPTTLLKSQIPIVISSELNREEPGHYQIDLVGHDGGNPNGQFSFSFDAIELSSGWVEPRGMLNKAQRWSLQALQSVARHSPVPVKSVHSDNDSAFLNESLQSWCQQMDIPYARGRPYHSNDTCFVEQKNYNIVRQALGYARFETHQELELITELYDNLRLLVNFFYPSVKLIEKKREGSRIRKTYDEPKSPCRRLLENPHVSNAHKLKLRHQKLKLDPLELKDNILRIQKRLLELVSRKGIKILYPGPRYPGAKAKMQRVVFGEISRDA